MGSLGCRRLLDATTSLHRDTPPNRGGHTRLLLRPVSNRIPRSSRLALSKSRCQPGFTVAGASVLVRGYKKASGSLGCGEMVLWHRRLCTAIGGSSSSILKSPLPTNHTREGSSCAKKIVGVIGVCSYRGCGCVFVESVGAETGVGHGESMRRWRLVYFSALRLSTTRDESLVPDELRLCHSN